MFVRLWEQQEHRNIPERSEYEYLEEEYGVCVGESVENVAVPKSGDLGSPLEEE